MHCLVVKGSQSWDRSCRSPFVRMCCPGFSPSAEGTLHVHLLSAGAATSTFADSFATLLYGRMTIGLGVGCGFLTAPLYTGQ
jgi:hypothetical protein